MLDSPLTDVERFPLLTESSRAMLRRLRQHPHAPHWTYLCGERLDAAGLADVQAFAERQRTSSRGWKFGEWPAWASDFVARCRRDVPFYRARLTSDGGDALPTCSRDDVRREPWSFVPDSADLAELIVYATSGTSGNLLHLPAHPVAPARYLPLFQAALSEFGASLTGGDRVSLIQVAAQVNTFTFASVSSYLGGAGFAKINLSPADWSAAEDRERFFDDCAPEIVTGDPFALEQLASLDLGAKPKGILSSATLLLPALRERLMRRFDCPVIDVYSMNESGPIAFARDADEHEILPHNLFVEILDDAGRPVAPGERGEIVVTGGVNPFLPLVRYRTGDFGALSFRHDVPRLVGVERRRPVVFHAVGGAPVVSISVTVALFKVPLPFFSLHQARDGTLLFRTRCDATTEQEIRQALGGLFGSMPLCIEQLPWEVAWSGKSIQYASEREAAS